MNLTGEDKIVEVEILSPSPEKFYFDDKGPVLDLKAKDEKGTHYNVEVQLRASDLDYIKRSLYYTTKLYSDQLKSGHEYHLLARSVSISILDFVLFPEREPLHSTFTLWERSQEFQLADDLELHYIELPTFTPDKPKSVRTRFEKWLYVLKFSDLYHTRELPDNIKEEEGVQMAIDSMRKAYARDDIRAYIEAQEKADRDRASIAAAARRRLEEAHRQLEDEHQRAEEERQRAEEERQRADEERQRAEQAERERDTERKKAEQEAQKSQRLAARLRELGVDPDPLTD